MRSQQRSSFVARLVGLACFAALTTGSIAQRPSHVRKEINDNLTRLTDEDWTVRALAAKRISQRAGVGPEYAPGIPALIKLLEIDAARQPAAKAISHIAYTGVDSKTKVPELEPAVEPLAKIIDGPDDEETRRWAVMAMSRIADNLGADVIQRVLPLLIIATGDPTTDVSRWAMEGLGDYGPESKSAIPAVIEQLEREDVRETAIKTLGRIKSDPQRCVPALVAELDRPSLAKERTEGELRFPIEQDIARAIAQFGPNAKDAVPALIKLVTSDQFTIREPAAFALGEIGPQAAAATDALDKAFNNSGDELSYTHIAIFAALCSIGPEGKQRAKKIATRVNGFVIDGDGHLMNNAADVLEVLATAPNITYLKLNTSELEDDQLAPLASMKQLEILLLPPTTSVDGLRHLSGLTHLQSLTHRSDFTYANQGKQITDDGLKHLAGLHNLRRLILWTNITGDGLRHLSGLKKLKELELEGVSDEGLEHFPELPLLENLLLGGKQLTGATISHLSHLNSLKTLSLGGSNVGDAGIAALAEDHPNLQELDLSMTKITAASVKDLSKFKKLKVLTIYATPLAGNKHILDLSRTNAVQALQKALPQCRVVYAD